MELPDDPRLHPDVYKLVLCDNEKLWQEWLELYDRAVVAGSAIPAERAWMIFRERYQRNTDGTWSAR